MAFQALLTFHQCHADTKSTFTLSYDKILSVWHCIKTTFTFIVLHKIISYDNHSHLVQYGGWICVVLKLDIAHVVHAICSGGLAKPCPVIRTSYRVDVHIGGKGSRTRRLIRNDGSSIISLYNVFVYDVHIIIFRHIHVGPSLYEMSFRTVMWMRENISHPDWNECHCLFLLSEQFTW